MKLEKMLCQSCAIGASVIFLITSTNGLSLGASVPSVVATPGPAFPISLASAKAEHVAGILRKLYPRTRIRVDQEANALVIIATPDEASAIRAVISAIDVKNLQEAQPEILHLITSSSPIVAQKLRPVFPHARFTAISRETLLVFAIPTDMTQIHAIVSALDVPPTTPTIAPASPGAAFHISEGQPSAIARAVARALPRLRVAVSGSGIVVEGPSDDLAQVKPLLEQLDRPRADTPYVAVYRLLNVDATSVADLLARSFSKLTFVVTKEINAISVSALQADHSRIADAITQLDTAKTSNDSQNSPFSRPDVSDFEIVSLHAAVPAAGGNGGASTTATDISQAVIQALSGIAPDLKITV